jgi:hypothetical protein
MNLDKLQSKLFLAGRSQTPDESVPYAFEKRIIARVACLSSAAPVTFWGRSLWKAAAVCSAVSIVLGAWSLQSAVQKQPVSLEATVFSMAKQLSETW